MREGKNKPEIRFKDFDSEWSKMYMGQCFMERLERSPKGELISVTINKGVVKASELNKIDNSSSDKSNYKVVKVGDLAYNSMRMWQGACGYSIYDGICSPAYTVVIPTKKANVIFFSYMFKRQECLSQFRLNSQGLTSDTWNLRYPAFSKILLSIPNNIDEQKKIGDLFNAIDSLIHNLELKLEKLRHIKQSLLDIMFVDVENEGQMQPRISFRGFEDEWGYENGKAIFRVYYEKNHPELPILSATQEYGMVMRDKASFQVQHNKENEASYKRVLPGQFVIHLRSFQGGFAHSPIDGITSPAYTIMEFQNKELHNDIFWKYVLSSKTFIKRLETVTYGIRDGRSISFNDFSELDFFAPKAEEQKKIGDLFNALDSLIRKQEVKLEKSRNIKQSLLQKMFV